MGLVKINNQVIPDRRNGNGRIRLDLADWVKLSITIFTTFAIIVFGAGKYISILNGHTEVLAEQAKEINKIPHIESDIINIKENLIYIRGKIDTLVLKIK